MLKPLKDLISFIVTLLEILLGLRLILKLFAADPKAPFVTWIYEASEPLLRPFAFAFPTASVKGGFVFEFTTLFALFAYAFIGYLIQLLLGMLRSYAQPKK
jgi:hypothetical protein